MKRKVWFWIIGVLGVIAILFIVLMLVLWTGLLWISPGSYGRMINIGYAAGKSENGGYYSRVLAPTHSLAKFSKIKIGMTEYEKLIELAGTPTLPIININGGYQYQLSGGWIINIQHSRIWITDIPNRREFGFELGECGHTLGTVAQTGDSIGAAALAGGRDGRPKHSLAKFSKIKIGMSPADVFKLAGKPADSVGTDFIWHRYKIDDGWYMNLHFYNEKLSDMAIADYPGNRKFELKQDDYTTTPAYLRAFAQAAGKSGAGTLTDSRDGKVYRTAKIGKFTWMAENLNYAADSSWCYEYEDSNCTKYGRMYNWSAAMEACPTGWRLPDLGEWWDLVSAAGGMRVAGSTLMSATGWEKGRPGTDEFGFSALPGGQSDTWGGRPHTFYGVGKRGMWWSATESNDWDGNATSAVFLIIFCFDDRNSVGLYSNGKANRFSLRCVEDAGGLR